MVVSISKMSIAYYLSTVAKGDVPQAKTKPLTAYYTETATPPGRWWGTGLTGLSGLAAGQQVDRRDAISIYDDLTDPATGHQLGRSMMVKHEVPEGAVTPTGAAAKDTRDAVAGFDLTFSVPKSVSTLWAVSGPALQQAIQQAHQQAVDETMAWTEREFIQSRAGKAGVAHVPVNGIIASMFDHWDSREGDPQLHTHVVVANRVQRLLDDQWVTLDSYTLHRHVVAISETYNSVLFDHLHNQLNALPQAAATDDPEREPIRDLLDAATTESTAAEDVSRSGMAVELAGVPDDLIREFSQRSVLIEQRKDELIDQYVEIHGHMPPQHVIWQLRQQATMDTRSAKADTTESLAEKMSGWRDRTLAAGHEPATVIENATGHDSAVITPDMLTADVRTQLADWVLADTSARRSTFTRANLLASAQRITRLVRFADMDDRMAVADDLVATAQDQAVSLTPDRSTLRPDTADVAVANRGRSVLDHQATAGVYTTATIMDQEQFVMDAATRPDGHGLAEDTVDRQLSQARMAGGHPLSDDKIRACRSMLTSDAGLSAVIGPAGTGKTSAMAAVKDIWEEHHGQASVVGLAPSAVAARVLGNELDVETDNVSKWLYESIGDGAARRTQRIQRLTNTLYELEHADRPQPQHYEKVAAQLAEQYAAQAKYLLRQDQLLVIDEASMVSTAQLAELTAQAQTAGAKVVLVGDPAQLGSVDAGGMLGWLDRSNKADRLSSVFRFKNDWEGSASLKLRKGDTSALELYEDAGRIVDAGDDAADAAYHAWLEDTRQDTSTILVAADNATVTDLNVRAQHDLAEAGVIDLNDTVTLKNNTFAGIGDKLLARRNERQLTDASGAFITNGTRLILDDIHADGSAIATNESTGASIVLDPDYLASSTELGYAVTAHRAQGVTVDTAHCVVDENQPRELFYVAMTRGKHGNYVYTATRDEHEAYDQADHPDNWGLMFEDKSTETPKDVLAKVLANESSEYTAHEIGNQERAWSNDLGRLCHELEYLRWSDRAHRTATWVQDTYTDPDTRQRLTNGEQWALLVDADPAHHFEGEPQTTDTVDIIRTQCQPRQQPTSVDDGNTMTNHQRQAVTDTQIQRIHAELRSRRASIAEEQPPWAETLPSQNSADYQDALDKVLLWRAVSNYDHDTHPLGPPPGADESKAVRAYYAQAHQALHNTSTTPEGHADRHNQLLASHAGLIDQLNDDPIDVSALDELFNDDTHAAHVPERDAAFNQHPGQPTPDWPDIDLD
ncbi:MAG: relaxase domain-containing protein [Micrococcaceae bacterium]|nr:relaxase domain-containing protein [Micrococcaceae bacterium]